VSIQFAATLVCDGCGESIVAHSSATLIQVHGVLHVHREERDLGWPLPTGWVFGERWPVHGLRCPKCVARIERDLKELTP